MTIHGPALTSMYTTNHGGYTPPSHFIPPDHQPIVPKHRFGHFRHGFWFGLGIGTASTAAYYILIQKRQTDWMLDTMSKIDILDIVPPTKNGIEPKQLGGKEWRHEYDTPIPPFQINPILGVVTVPLPLDGEKTRFVHYAQTYPTLDNLHPILKDGENVVPIQALKDDIGFLGATVGNLIRREEYEMGMRRDRVIGISEGLWDRGLDWIIRGLEGMKKNVKEDVGIEVKQPFGTVE